MKTCAPTWNGMASWVPGRLGLGILVCISTSALSERLVRIGQRMAADLNAEWYAVYVESPQERPSDEAAMDRLARSMRLAEDLGAKVQTLSGRSIAGEIISFAQISKYHTPGGRSAAQRSVEEVAEDLRCQ